MDSLLNPNRPPVFCPGCAHERVVHSLDEALRAMGLSGERIAIVSDIGCSGLFDTFFNTHAFHGLHGRALTYATGIKMANPDLTVIVTMGDGGLGIGGAHVLSTCRRNIDLTLLVLNNFNYGMTGGQCSATTPREAHVGSGFLNRLEKPMDICKVAASAGAGFVARASAYDKELAGAIRTAAGFSGFSVVDIWGVCPGRYTRRNKLTPRLIEEQMAARSPAPGVIAENASEEYTAAYRREASRSESIGAPARIEAVFAPPITGRREVVLLGSAGQRIVTAGELICLAGASAGLHATQKNDYPITVMRGHSVSELILSTEPIGYTGMETPATVIALAREGALRRSSLFARLGSDALVVKAAGVELPPTDAQVIEIDFKSAGIRSQDWALASLAMLARENREISTEMLEAALAFRFKKAVLEKALDIVKKTRFFA